MCVFCSLALFGLARSASIDRYESEKPAQITVINMWGPHSDRRTQNVPDAAHYDYDEEYYDDEGEYDEVASGSDEIDLPRGTTNVKIPNIFIKLKWHVSQSPSN